MSEIKVNICIEYYQLKIPLIKTFSSAIFHKSDINLNLSDFPQLQIKNSIIKPYKYFYVSLNEELFSDFKHVIFRILNPIPISVLKKLEIIITNQEGLSLEIFNSNMSKKLKSTFVNENLPLSLEELIQINKKRRWQWNLNYLDFFYEFHFSENDVDNSIIKKEFVGYTGQPSNILMNGKELGCQIVFENNDNVVDYIFVKNIKAVAVQYFFTIQEFFIMPDIKIIEFELLKLFFKYSNVKKINCLVKLYDFEQLKQSFKEIEQNKNLFIKINTANVNHKQFLNPKILEYNIISKSLEYVKPELDKKNRIINNYSIEYKRHDYNEQLRKNSDAIKEEWDSRRL